MKKLGRIPDGRGWRVDGRVANTRDPKTSVGSDYVHAPVDHHTRLAYDEIHPDEKGASVARFLTRAAEHFASHGITRIERVISDNAFAYRHSAAFKTAVTDLGALQKFIKPHLLWRNGKVERFDRTLATEWAYPQPYTSNADRAAALAPWIEHYDTERIHTRDGMTPASHVSPT